MRVTSVKALIPSAAAALLTSAPLVFGADGVNLMIANDGTDDLYVSVYDASSRAPIVEHQRLNGFTAIMVSANPDETGLANITWTSISVDNRDRRCGRGTSNGLDNDATVNVHADSSCQS